MFQAFFIVEFGGFMLSISKKYFIYFFFALSNLATVVHAHLLADILQRQELKVGTTGDYKPFSYLTQEKKYIGLDIEMAERLAAGLGVKLTLVPTTWSTLMDDLAAQKFDIGMAGISVNLERQKQAFFSVPYAKDGKTPITLCKNQQKFQTLEQIDQPNVTTIVNPGGTNEKFARTHLKHATIKMHPDNVTIFAEIIKGNADLMITDSIETQLQQTLHSELCAVHPDKPFNFFEKAYLLPQDIHFKLFVDQWLRQEIESGAFQQHFDKWLKYSW